MFYFKDEAEAKANKAKFEETFSEIPKRVAEYKNNCLLVGARVPNTWENIEIEDGIVYNQRNKVLEMTYYHGELPDRFYVPNWSNLEVLLHGDKNTHLYLCGGQYKKVKVTEQNPYGIIIESVNAIVPRQNLAPDCYHQLCTSSYANISGADIKIRLKELSDREFRELLNIKAPDRIDTYAENIYSLIIRLCRFHTLQTWSNRQNFHSPKSITLYAHYYDLYIFIRELAIYITQSAEQLRVIKDTNDLGMSVKIYVKKDALIKETLPSLYRLDWQPVVERYNNTVTIEFLKDFLDRVQTYPYGVKYRVEKDHINVSILNFFYMKIYIED